MTISWQLHFVGGVGRDRYPNQARTRLGRSVSPKRTRERRQGAQTDFCRQIRMSEIGAPRWDPNAPAGSGARFRSPTSGRNAGIPTRRQALSVWEISVGRQTSDIGSVREEQREAITLIVRMDFRDSLA